MSRHVRLTGAVALFAATAAATPPEIAPPPRPVVSVADLVRDLGSPDYAARERASARLAALEVGEPPPELLSATASANPEVQRRAVAAAAAIRAQAALRGLTPAERFARAGAIDRLVANSASWTGPADNQKLWKPVCTAVDLLCEKAGVKGRYASFADVARFGKDIPMTFVRADRPYRQPEPGGPRGGPVFPEGVVAPAVTSPDGMNYSTVVAYGPVITRTNLSSSVVFANGAITVGLHCSRSVVVADGDVDIGGNADDCLVLARGDIRVKGVAMRCTLAAGGRVAVGKAFVPPPDRPEFGVVVADGERSPLGFVTWFELAAVGVEVGKAYGGLAVQKVAAGKPFAAAGVRPGDLVLKVGEDAVATPEEFRRRLRDAHATAAEAAVHLRRDGQPLTVRVPLPQ